MLRKPAAYIISLTSLILLMFAASSGAQKEQETKPAFSPAVDQIQVQSNDQGIAIDGFDPVAYFDDGKAVKGLPTHSCEYLNTTWHFSSAENRDKFLANPEKFSPQYGGYCAHSLSNNKIIESNPQSFSIRDDKLYLYVNDRLADNDLKKDEETFSFIKKKRDNNWLTFESNF